MNDLYIHQLETENKQLRTELHIERARILQAIEYIKENKENTEQKLDFDEMKTYNVALMELLEILENKENNTITLSTKDMNISYRGKDERQD